MPHFKFENSNKREKVGNLLAASFFGIFAFIYLKGLLSSFRLSLLLMLIKETLDISFFLCRKAPISVNYRVISWIVAIGGTLTPLLLMPTTPSADSVTGDVLQCAGLAFQIVAIASLNKSWGIVPAIREIKTTGTYRFVRHPLYLSYFITLTGFVINNFSLNNMCVLMLAIALQLDRINKEEAFLSQDPGYLEYASHTKWKIIPFFY